MNERSIFALEGQAANETVFGFGRPRWQSHLDHQESADFAVNISGGRNHPALLQAARLIDGLTILLTTFVVLRLEHRHFLGHSLNLQSAADMVAVLFFVTTNRRWRLGETRLRGIVLQQALLLTPPLVLAAAVHACVLVLLGSSFSALAKTTGVWTCAAMLGLVMTRTAAAAAATHDIVQRHLTRKIAIIGSDAYSFRMAERLANNLHKSFQVVGVFDDRPVTPGQRPLTGSIADLINLSRGTKLHCIIIAMAPGTKSQAPMPGLGLRLRHVLADIYTLPHLISADVTLPVEMLGPMSFMVLQRRPLDEVQLFRKRCLDLAFGLVAGAIFLAPLLLVAAAIKLESRGPVLFRQPRRGYNNRQFTVFKFRTMYTNQSDFLSERQTSRGDPRVTRAGKWLRRLSIDELPQILNVILGDMSLVGPRPHALHTRVEGQLLNDALAEYLIRYQVKPGITGWAQINGARGELVTNDDLRRRVALDLEYIQHWSVWFDLRIMVLTATREVFSKHAY
jgi:Undecaprenyl-phosphate glucose phosphotransferase